MFWFNFLTSLCWLYHNCTMPPPNMLAPPTQPPLLVKAEYDYIIGAGSAGSVLARRLSEQTQRTVLLIEAGSNSKDANESHVPSQVYTSLGSSIDWNYTTTPQTHACFGMHNNQCMMNRGKVLGGSSVLNYMADVRGHPDDYNRWSSAYNLPGWSWSDVLPYFKKLENTTQFFGDLAPADQAVRSTSGPLAIIRTPLSSISQDFDDAALSVGYTINDDYNGVNPAGGFSPLQFNIKNGYRDSTLTAYLMPAMPRPNLDVVVNALVTKVLINNNNVATGVQFSYRTAIGNIPMTKTVTARKEVIVCAGALDSPKLLMLSGVGPQDHLQAFSIPVKKHSPKVGQHLIDHLTVWQTFQTNASVNHAAPEYTGFTDSGFSLHAGMDDIQHFFAPADILDNCALGPKHNLKPDVCQTSLGSSNTNQLSLTIMTTLNYVSSVGEVRLQSSNPEIPALFDPKYLQDANEHDIKALTGGMKNIRRILDSAPYAKYNVQAKSSPVVGCEGITMYSDEYYKCYIQQVMMNMWHYAGTCQMGTDITNSVVNNRLKVHGIDRLRVVDASVFPDQVRGNIHIPIVMIAEKAADMIKADNP